ncbi:hypothetical protein [Rhizorhabdus sp.]|uniref:hypothetical protein n=1 Tax=Rhizorhabdus sp. TaxID=1968843 RepID=UPI0035B1A65D
MADASTNQRNARVGRGRPGLRTARISISQAVRLTAALYGAYRRGFDNPVADRLMPVMLILVAACFVMMMIASAWA